MVISQEIVQGNYRPFEVFQKKADFNLVMEFINHSDRHLLSMVTLSKLERIQSIKNLINEFNQLTFRKLSRMLKQYDITHQDFVLITYGFFEQRIAEIMKAN